MLDFFKLIFPLKLIFICVFFRFYTTKKKTPSVPVQNGLRRRKITKNGDFILCLATHSKLALNSWRLGISETNLHRHTTAKVMLFLTLFTDVV